MDLVASLRACLASLGRGGWYQGNQPTNHPLATDLRTVTVADRKLECFGPYPSAPHPQVPSWAGLMHGPIPDPLRNKLNETELSELFGIHCRTLRAHQVQLPASMRHHTRCSG